MGNGGLKDQIITITYNDIKSFWSEMKKHGGKRKGAGRKKTKEPTKTVRIPVSLLPKVEALIKKHKSKPFHGLSEAGGGF